jgi:hypothetical protein
MKKLILASVLLLVSFFSAQAQGAVNEKAEPGIASLMTRYVELNKATPNLKGWRIQILATTDRQRMEDALRQFGSLYPSVPADWVHNKPYYKVRAGAFTSKREALRTLYILKKDYPTAYPVQDDQIKPEELLR